MPSYNNNYGFGGYPYGMPYQPIPPQTQQNPQPNYNAMYQNQQPQQPQMNQYAFVNGVEGAKSFQLAPNQTIMLMDSDSPVCYMKTSNSVGQSTLRYFKLTEVSENDLKAQAQPEKKEDMSNYVLKSDFDLLSKRLDELSKKFEKPYKKENKE